MRSLFLFILACAHAWAAPPEVPAELSARPGQLIRVVAKGESEIGTLRNFKDDDAFFDELAPKPGQRRFVFQSDKPGVYVVGFWTKGEVEGVSCTITVGDPTAPPPKPPVNPPVNPPAPAGYFFLIVRPDGPADPKFTAAMSLPAWKELGKAGHKFKDKTVTAAASDLDVSLPYNTPLPAVLTLVVDGNASRIIAGPVPLPTDESGILALPKGVK